MKKRIPVSEQSPLLQSPFTELEITPSEKNEPLSLEEPITKEPLAKFCGWLILQKEKAHRAGKTVLILRGFSPKISKETIQSLAKEAKVACGCGGTVTNRKIKLQGNQPERVKRFFESKGFRVSGIC